MEKKVQKKLVLRKESISSLTDKNMYQIVGGSVGGNMGCDTRSIGCGGMYCAYSYDYTCYQNCDGVGYVGSIVTCGDGGTYTLNTCDNTCISNCAMTCGVCY